MLLLLALLANDVLFRIIMNTKESTGLIPDLNKFNVFEGVSDDVKALVTPDMIRYFENGEVISPEDAEETDLILLLRGQADIYCEGVYLVSRQAPAVIGEQSLIEQDVRSATIKAAGHVRAVIIPEPVAERLLQDPTFARNMLKVLSKKLRESTRERAYRYRIEQNLFTEFKAHVTPEVTHQLLETGRNYGAPRYIENAVVLMSDIRSFTTLSGAMTPEQIAADLSPYLSRIVDVIHAHGGVVDKFIGDAVLAFWGLNGGVRGLSNEEAAVYCAAEMVRAADAMRFGGAPIKIGVGLSRGRVFAGNVGSDGKRQFTILGMPVNLAARYESLSKELKTAVVAGESIFTSLPETARQQFTVFPNQAIKGDVVQTLYGFEPAIAAGSQEEKGGKK